MIGKNKKIVWYYQVPFIVVLSSTKVNSVQKINVYKNVMTKLTKSPETILSARGQLILATAQHLFLKHGYDDTSLEMIISEAGGSRRSIYSEFGNKQGLLLAVIKSMVATQTNTLTNIDLKLAPADALKIICSRFVVGLLSKEMVALFRLVTHLAVKMPEIGQIVYEKGPLVGIRPIVNYFEYLEAQNILVISDKLFSAQLLIEMVSGHLHMKTLLLPEQKLTAKEIDDYVDKAVKQFLAAYL